MFTVAPHAGAWIEIGAASCSGSTTHIAPHARGGVNYKIEAARMTRSFIAVPCAAQSPNMHIAAGYHLLKLYCVY